MVPTNPQSDLIVEILRLAYRRGIAVQQDKERNESSNQSPSQSNELLDQSKADIKESTDMSS